jgi:hypothetical protein
MITDTDTELLEAMSSACELSLLKDDCKLSPSLVDDMGVEDGIIGSSKLFDNEDDNDDDDNELDDIGWLREVKDEVTVELDTILTRVLDVGLIGVAEEVVDEVCNGTGTTIPILLTFAWLAISG